MLWWIVSLFWLWDGCFCGLFVFSFVVCCFSLVVLFGYLVGLLVVGFVGLGYVILVCFC